MSTTVTMRPRRFRTPAISADDSGTRVTRSGMNTSCTREIGRPNSWPPITAVTNSDAAPSVVSILLLIARYSCPFVSRGLLVGVGARPLLDLLFHCRDQAGPVELGDVVVEPGLAAALDRSRRHQRRHRDHRQ